MIRNLIYTWPRASKVGMDSRALEKDGISKDNSGEERLTLRNLLLCLMISLYITIDNKTFIGNW